MEKEYELHLQLAQGQQNKFLGDHLLLEQIIRLNPYWKITEITGSTGEYEINGEDHETAVPFAVKGEFETSEANGVTITAKEESWSSITFFERDGAAWATVNYHEEPDEAEEQKIVYWLRSIREYLRLYVTSNLWTKAHRYMMNKILLPMSPSQRKISLMMIRVTIVEIVVIIAIVAGYFCF